MKHIRIDIEQKLAPQFIKQFNMSPIGDEFEMDPTIGNGRMHCIEFPSKLEFYHFKSCEYKTPISMTSINAKHSDWFLFHINLSQLKQTKHIDDKVIEFQKHLPIGLLIYGPGIQIHTKFPTAQNVEVASFRFHKDFLSFYFGNQIKIEEMMSYENLDYRMEELLRLALAQMHNKILCHRHLLEFITLLTEKLKKRHTQQPKVNIHAVDIKSLFIAAARLRNPTAIDLPLVNDLAISAGMGMSKFKMCFKQLFGTSPKQFHHKIRMEYAMNELLAKRKTPTQLSYEFGYSHPSNFTSAFKKYFNKLPSDCY